MIVGLAGKLCSGKTTIAEILKEKRFEILRFSDILKEELEKRGLEKTRENFIKLGQELAEKYGKSFLSKRLTEKIDKNKDYVLDGIRRKEEAIFFKDNFGKDFILIFVEADRDIRKKRFLERKRDIDVESFEKLDKEDEEIGIDECKDIADIIIKNNFDSIEELKKVVEGSVNLLLVR